MDEPRRGRFVSIEGGEGAGKSTQLRRLAESLRGLGQAVVTTREPGGTPGAEALRGLLLSGEFGWALPAEILLHFAARAEHVDKVIRPALAAGSWVLTDRFADSTLVYQGYGQGGDRAMIGRLTAMLGIVPDLTIVLDVSVPTSVARLAARGAGADRYERLGEGFFARLRAGFAEIAAAEPRCVLVDAEASVDMVAARVLAAVRARLG